MSGKLTDLLAPKSGSTVLIYDVQASESGALAILDDLYAQVSAYPDKSVKWVFIVSVPKYRETEQIVVERFPWVKKNWGCRYYFDTVFARKLIKKYEPDQVFSLQNKGIDFYRGPQTVYLHLPVVLTDHRFSLRRDGKRIWLYQNVLYRGMFRSARQADKTIVQTQWMKEALVKKAKVSPDKIVVQQPDIGCNGIGSYKDTPENRRRLFYPAMPYTYKNHATLLKALRYAQAHGLNEYELILTIVPEQSKYTRQLYAYAQKNGLHVKFGGPIPREEVFKTYESSVLVFPSYVESFGLPLLEAKLTGSPILASDTPFCREILKDYDKVLFFPESDESALGKYLLGVCEGTLL